MDKTSKLKKISINTPDGDNYDINIASNIIDNIGEYIKHDYGSGKITLITDKIVHKLYFERIKKALDMHFSRVSCILVEAGEMSKSIETLEYVTNQLTQLNHRRSDLIIAFGGGVIGDLAGFVASIYLRGVPYIQIPTTLLSQVDSSVGGKVAINIESGKNLIGSFYNPLAVYIDTDTLRTLKKEQIKDGLGEVIKYGFIKTPSIIDDLLKYKIETVDNIDFVDLISKCLMAKKYFVEKDYYDKKDRMILNFGHTLAHAIEKEYGYGNITHGQAVGAGMYMISKVLFDSSKIESEIYREIEELLLNYEMNKIYKLDTADTIKAILNDKKSFADSINVIAVKERGNAEILKINIKEFAEILKIYLNN